MPLSSRPNTLRALSERKTLWLAIPALAAVALLVMIGRQSADAPVATAQTPAVEVPSPAPVNVVAAEEPSPAPDNVAAAMSFTSEQKQAIGPIIKDYLLAHPEILLEVQTALEGKMEKEQAEKLKVAIAENATEIYRGPNAAVAGNHDGDITVVEFFDYNCGYCKRGLGDVVKLLDSDPKVRVVFKELPILSKGSEEAARIALAARNQGKYWEVHRALLKSKGQANEASAMKIAEKLGLDMEKLKEDMASEEITAEIKQSEALASKMGINGTPHFLIGNRSIPGAPQDLFNQLSTHVGELRKTGCTYC